MSEGLLRLKEIGAQKIHEDTHIAKHHAQALIHESFEDITEIHLNGFISILQREYDIDLDDLTQQAQEYYAQNKSTFKKEKKVFVTPKKSKNYTIVYLVIVAIIFIIAITFSFKSSSSVSASAKTSVLDNKAIEVAKENLKISNLKVIYVEKNENLALDKNQTNLALDKNETSLELNKSEILAVKSFKIIAKKKLWLGYMDIETRKKKQTMFTGEFDLDPSKDWLLSLGHGYADVEIDANVTEYKSKYNIKLIYKDSKITKISFKEYKVINKGSKW